MVSTQKPTVISALGAIPKPDSTEIRLIHDCSRPHGYALNDYATANSFKFQSLDEAIGRLRPHYYMAKIDLRHAYRSVPIHPSNYTATGLKWWFAGDSKPTYFFDTRLPFGAKSSPEIFHRLTQAVRRMMERRGFHDVIVYLDDFLVIAPTKEECERAYHALSQLLRDLGFTISLKKLVPPTQCLTFLGIQLNTGTQEMTLPPTKLAELQSLVSQFQQKRRATKRELQRLAGKLNWACRVVYGGRTFLRRVIDQINLLTKPNAKFRLSRDFHLDLGWWAAFLARFNGKCPFLDTRPVVDVQTDACPVAAGAWFRGDWYYSNFQMDAAEPHHALHINHKETLAIILAAKRWCASWTNTHVIIQTDNQAAAHIINNGSTSHPIIMQELRSLFWLSARHNFRITAEYLPGTQNEVADAISRLHDPHYCQWFYTHLLSLLPRHHVDKINLLQHMSGNSLLFVSSSCTHSHLGSGTPGRNCTLQNPGVHRKHQGHLQDSP